MRRGGWSFHGVLEREHSIRGVLQRSRYISSARSSFSCFFYIPVTSSPVKDDTRRTHGEGTGSTARQEEEDRKEKLTAALSAAAMGNMEVDGGMLQEEVSTDEEMDDGDAASAARTSLFR